MSFFTQDENKSVSDLLKASLASVKLYQEKNGHSFILQDAQKFIEKAIARDTKKHKHPYTTSCREIEKESLHKKDVLKNFHTKLNNTSQQELHARAEVAHKKQTEHLRKTGQLEEEENSMLDNETFSITIEADKLELLPKVLSLFVELQFPNHEVYIKSESKEKIVVSLCHPDATSVGEHYPLEVLLPLITHKLTKLDPIKDPFRSFDGSSFPAFILTLTQHGLEIKRTYVYAGK